MPNYGSQRNEGGSLHLEMMGEDDVRFRSMNGEGRCVSIRGLTERSTDVSSRNLRCADYSVCTNIPGRQSKGMGPSACPTGIQLGRRAVSAIGPPR
ncbi:hypothetical protein CEXT_102931 [Caerostris extrusa]|uniref:Uncharacterized protein n=1 Tax=Caerostris extrusa TaxID=172846 RepID=A0AAV4X4D7_CAEEX|nr:hypothetical protein CEXT_102931 [Caerostris extrusa]